MSYFFWLGREADDLQPHEINNAFRRIMAEMRDEILARQAECKPEADGWITLHPKV